LGFFMQAIMMTVQSWLTVPIFSEKEGIRVKGYKKRKVL
jgi:hypothetical protein